MAANKRGSTIFVNPHEILISGLDFESNHDDPLYEPSRNALESTPERVQTAKELGVGVVEAIRRKEGLVVVAGRQRVKDARTAGLDVVEVKILRGLDNKDLALRVVAENCLRRDYTVLEKVAHASRMRSHGMTDAEIAVGFGVSGQSIRDWLVIEKVDDSVKEAVEDGRISAYQATKIGRKAKTPEAQQAKLAEVIKAKASPKKGATGAAAAAAPKKNTNKSLARAMAQEDAETLKEGAVFLDETALLALKWAHGLATTAECDREIPGFKQARARAKRRLA